MKSNKVKLAGMILAVVLMIIAPWVSVFIPKWNSGNTMLVVSTLMTITVLLSTLNQTKPQE